MSNVFGVAKGGRQFRPATANYEEMERHGDKLLHKHAGPGESEIGVSGQLEHTNDDGSTQDLARQIAQVYRRVTAPLAGQSLVPAQRRSIRDQIIGTMDGQGNSDTQEAIRVIASVMAGLPPFEIQEAVSATVLKSAPDSSLSVFVPFLRKDEGKREVHGIIAQEEPDKSGEIFDYQSSKPHFQTWVNDATERTVGAGLPISYGNVRAQHSGLSSKPSSP